MYQSWLIQKISHNLVMKIRQWQMQVHTQDCQCRITKDHNMLYVKCKRLQRKGLPLRVQVLGVESAVGARLIEYLHSIHLTWLHCSGGYSHLPSTK